MFQDIADIASLPSVSGLIGNLAVCADGAFGNTCQGAENRLVALIIPGTLRHAIPRLPQ